MSKLDVPVKSMRSPIYRNFQSVSRHLFLNKVTNLTLALDGLNGVVIKPGETFSFWNLAGKPTARRGYLPGLVIERGKPGEGIGGGLCQLANMIHYLALHSELEIVERHRHSFDVFPDDDRTVPFASGATVVYNYKDLRLKNNSNKEYQLYFALTDTLLSGELLCSEVPANQYAVIEKDHAFMDNPDGLYRRNSLFRQVITENGVSEEFLYDNYCKCNYTRGEIVS
jgi:vancomycin resistance protein VanW